MIGRIRRGGPITQGCGAHALETGSDLCGRGTVGPGLTERTVGPPTCDAALHSTVDSIRSLEEAPTSPGTELQWGGSSLDSTLALISLSPTQPGVGPTDLHEDAL